MTSTPSYDVDPAFVRDLAAGLRRVQATLDALGRLEPERLDLGSPLVARALHDVGANWSVARRRIAEEIGALAHAADLAAGRYVDAEDGLAAALGAPTVAVGR